MAAVKKPVEPKLELLKNIKNFYKDYIQLNFDKYFILNYDGVDGKINILFEPNNYYYIKGEIKLKMISSTLYKWLTKIPSSVKILNDDLDKFRKANIKDIIDLNVTDESYEIKYKLKDDDEEKLLKLVRTPCVGVRSFNDRLKYTLDLPLDEISKYNDYFIVYRTENGITLEEPEHTELSLELVGKSDNVAFDSPIKNIKIKFKKNATYKLHIFEGEENYLVSVEAESDILKLTQYFRCI